MTDAPVPHGHPASTFTRMARIASAELLAPTDWEAAAKAFAAGADGPPQ